MCVRDKSFASGGKAGDVKCWNVRSEKHSTFISDYFSQTPEWPQRRKFGIKREQALSRILRGRKEEKEEKFFSTNLNECSIWLQQLTPASKSVIVIGLSETQIKSEKMLKNRNFVFLLLFGLLCSSPQVKGKTPLQPMDLETTKVWLIGKVTPRANHFNIEPSSQTLGWLCWSKLLSDNNSKTERRLG
jgi:hypothetical protein